MFKPMLHGALLCFALATANASALSDGDMAPADQALAKIYWSGHESLKKSDWNEALERFRRLEVALRDKEPDRVDGAIYWQAYTLAQARRNAEAKAAVERLHREFTNSRWAGDADALLRQSTAAKAAADDGSELAEVAIEGLMSAPPERALPLLRKVLQGNQPTRVKKRALFVMSQIDEPGALAVLGEIARNGADAGLREEAIRMLGISGNPKAVEQLREMFASSKSVEEKRRIVQAWIIADRPDLVLAAARTEPDAGVRREAIQALGVLNAGAELSQLFDAEKDPGNRSAILQAFGVAGDRTRLSAIAESAQPEAVRIEAIRGLGIAGDGEALLRVYAKVDTPALRAAVREGLMISGDGKALLKLYRSATSADEKRELLRTLTLVGGDDALDAIEAELGAGGAK